MRIVQLINETTDIYYIQYEYDNQSINRRNVKRNKPKRKVYMYINTNSRKSTKNTMRNKSHLVHSLSINKLFIHVQYRTPNRIQ